MIIKIGETLKDIITLFFLLLIIVFVFSLLGVELFKNKAKINRFNEIVSTEDPLGYSPRQNFDDFLNAFVSVFVCLIGEDWQLIMHDYVRASKSMAVQTYFIVLMVIGNLFLMNLFLAILLKNFEDKKESKNEEADEQVEEDVYNINYLQKSMKLQFRRVFFKKEVQPAPQKPKRESEIAVEKSEEKSLNSYMDHDQGHRSNIGISALTSEDKKVSALLENSSENKNINSKNIDRNMTQNEQNSAELQLEGGSNQTLMKQKSTTSYKSVLSDSKSY